MTDDYVTPETLKLASEKGIDWQSELLLPEVLPDGRHKYPTQSMFQKLLRKKHNIDISVSPYGNKENVYTYIIKIKDKIVRNKYGYSGWKINPGIPMYYGYEKSLEAAFIETIESL